MIVASLIFAAAIGCSSTLQIVPPDGARRIETIRVEWMDTGDEPLLERTLSLAERSACLPSAPPGAVTLRVVGPDVISLPVPIDSREKVQLRAAGRLRLSPVPRARRIAVFMSLAGGTLDFRRVIDTSDDHVETAAPIGTYSLVVDVGREVAPAVVGEIAIEPSATTALSLSPSPGKPLSLVVRQKQGGGPVEGASLRPRLSPDFPRPFWMAMARRCARSSASGLLVCGRIPTSLAEVEVVAPKRRSARVQVKRQPAGQLEETPTEVHLAAYQTVVVHASIPDDEEALRDVTTHLVACARPPCEATPTVTRMSAGGEGVFPQVEPGQYRASLHAAAIRSTSTAIVVSDDSADVDTLRVKLDLALYRIHGAARLSDGAGVPASVSIGTLGVAASQAEFAGELTTEPTGEFELSVLAQPGSRLLAHASSTSPLAEGETEPPGVRLPDDHSHVRLDIELSRRGSILKLIDRESRGPVEGCRVTFRHHGENRGGIRVARSDADGLVHWLGLSEGRVVAETACEGYAPTSLHTSSISEMGRPALIELDHAVPARLRVREANGHRLPGALVFVQQAASDRVSSPFKVSPELIGVTDIDGEIVLPARENLGVYVIARGHALRTLAIARCVRADECVEDVQLHRPAPFAGIRVSDAAGQPLSAAWLVFSKDGVPIPVQIQSEVVRANGRDLRRDVIVSEGTGTIHMLPALFGTGVYEVGYASRQDAQRVVSLGRIVLPSNARIELTVPSAASQTGR